MVKSARPRVNPETVKKMVRRYRQGASFSTIGEEFGVHRDTAARCIRKYLTRNDHKKVKLFPDLAKKWPGIVWLLDQKKQFAPLAAHTAKEIEALFALADADRRIAEALATHAVAPHLDADDVAFVRRLKRVATPPAAPVPENLSSRCGFCGRATGWLLGYGPKICSECGNKLMEMFVSGI